MTDSRSISDEFPSISTSAELDKHRAERLKPTLDQALVPDGPDQTAIMFRIAHSVEARIAFLEERMEAAREISLAEHRLSATRGLTRLEFEQSR